MSAYYDLLKASNILPINVIFIRFFGISAATYLCVAMDPEGFSLCKSRITDIEGNSFTLLDRKKVEKLTSISEKEQKDIEDNFSKSNILYRCCSNIEAVRIDIPNLLEYVTVGDEGKPPKKTRAFNKKTVAEKKEDKLKFSLENTIKKISTTNEELRQAYEEWLRMVAENYSRSSVALLRDAEKVIDEYSNHNLDVALEVLQLAIAYTCLNMYTAVQKREARVKGAGYNNSNTVGKYNKTTVTQKSVGFDTDEDFV